MGVISLKDWAGGRDARPPSSPAFSPAGVGKSSLLLRFADNTFSGECAPGVLLEYFGFEIPLPGRSFACCLSGSKNPFVDPSHFHPETSCAPAFKGEKEKLNIMS